MKDSTLAKLEASLPSGWEMFVQDDEITIRRKAEIWALFENRINAPVSRESAEARAERIRKNGQKSICRFVFRIEKKWTTEKIKEARESNESLLKAAGALPRKYGIVGFLDEHLSRKGELVFIGKTEDDKKRIDAYRKERESLLAGFIKIPDCTTEKYSLFLLRKEGMEDDLHIIHPEEASREMYAIQSRLHELCGTSR
ncbi:MAG: hypothetical protein HYU64_04610 [Armatimonadetes bacterium]|nr:hypothetical protein [Armatimonadota bacterium]